MTADNKAVAMRWQDMFRSSQEDLSKLDEFLAADFISHSAPPGLDPGIEGVKQMISIFQNAFPDMKGAVEDVVAEGDKVVVRFSGTATHQGEFFGIPPTGKSIKSTGINIFRIEAGKIIEHWNNADDLGLLQQLGVIPS
ncbi:MAG: ester cyclase [Anaerolineae bacterium]|nr:ester cyclase [Anaerolineae bacterium]